MSSEVPQQSPPGGFSVSMAGDVDAAFYRQTAHISEEEARSEVSTEALGKVSSKLVGGTVQVPLRRHTERETASERRPQYISDLLELIPEDRRDKVSSELAELDDREIALLHDTEVTQNYYKGAL